MDSLADLANLPWQGLGLGGLVTIAIIYIFTGRLVPKSVYDEMRQSKDKEIERWMQVAQSAEALADKNADIATIALEGGRTTNRLVDTLRETVTEVRRIEQ